MILVDGRPHDLSPDAWAARVGPAADRLRAPRELAGAVHMGVTSDPAETRDDVLAFDGRTLGPDVTADLAAALRALGDDELADLVDGRAVVLVPDGDAAAR